MGLTDDEVELLKKEFLKMLITMGTMREHCDIFENFIKAKREGRKTKADKAELELLYILETQIDSSIFDFDKAIDYLQKFFRASDPVQLLAGIEADIKRRKEPLTVEQNTIAEFQKGEGVT